VNIVKTPHEWEKKRPAREIPLGEITSLVPIVAFSRRRTVQPVMLIVMIRTGHREDGRLSHIHGLGSPKAVVSHRAEDVRRCGDLQRGEWELLRRTADALYGKP